VSRRLALLAVLGVAVVVGAVGAVLWATSSDDSTPTKPLSSLGPLEPAPPPGRLGAELVPIPAAPRLAPAGSMARQNRTVNGIKCEFNARLVLHHHVHLTLVVNGKPRRVPAGVGVWPPIGPENYRNGQFGGTPDTCLSWLSTRYPDGLIHVEAPIQRSFVLGEFFDVWGQPLSRSRVGPARGDVTAIVNKEVWTGDPREIPLDPHAQIQLQVGRPLVTPGWIEFPGLF
jgi:hypothetical protein